MKLKKSVSILLIITCIFMLVFGVLSTVKAFTERSTAAADNKDRTAAINNLSEQITALELKRDSYDADKAVYDEQLAEYTKKENEYKSTLADYEYIKDMLDASWDTYEQVKSAYDQGKTALDEGKSQLDEGKQQLSQVKDALEQTQTAYEEGKIQYEQARAQLDAAEQALGIQYESYETDKEVYIENIEDLNALKEAAAQLQAQSIDETVSSDESSKSNTEIKGLKEQLLDVIEQLAEATGTTDLYNELEQKRQEIESRIIAFLMSGQDSSTLDGQIKSALVKIMQKTMEISQNVSDDSVQLTIPDSLGISGSTLASAISSSDITSYASAEEQIEQAEQQLATAKAQLDQYEQAQALVASMETQLDQAEAQVTAGEQQLAQAKEVVDQFESQQAEQEQRKSEIDSAKSELDEENKGLEAQRKNLSIFTTEERNIEDNKAKFLSISEIADKIDNGDNIVNAAEDYVKVEKKSLKRTFFLELVASLMMLTAFYFTFKTIRAVRKKTEITYRMPVFIALFSLFAYIFGKISGYHGMFLIIALLGMFTGVLVFYKKYRFEDNKKV